MKVKLALAVALLETVVGVSLPALADDSSPLEHTPRISVRTEIPPVNVHHDLSASMIAALSRTMGAVGHTRMRLHTTAHVDATFVSTSRGEKSFWVSGVNVTIWYESIDVYLPREHAEGSCEYQGILAHEKEHIRVDRELVEEYAEKIKVALLAASFPTYQSPGWVSSYAEGAAQEESRLQSIVRPLEAEFKSKRPLASQALDTPESQNIIGQRYREE